jgi:hypothetical protein
MMQVLGNGEPRVVVTVTAWKNYYANLHRGKELQWLEN